MFVPSLSWQNDRFYIEIAQKWRFSQELSAVPAQEHCGAGAGNAFFLNLHFSLMRKPIVCENRLWTNTQRN
jgi:hypothetical protein